MGEKLRVVWSVPVVMVCLVGVNGCEPGQSAPAEFLANDPPVGTYITDDIVFSGDVGHTIAVEAAPLDSPGRHILIRGGTAGPGVDNPGGTVDIVGGMGTGTGMRGSIGVGRLDTSIVTVGGPELLQLHMRGQAVFTWAVDEYALRSLRGPVLVDAQTGVTFRVNGVDVWNGTQNGNVTIGGAPGATTTIEGDVRLNLLAELGELYLDAQSVRVGTQSPGVEVSRNGGRVGFFGATPAPRQQCATGTVEERLTRIENGLRALGLFE